MDRFETIEQKVIYEKLMADSEGKPALVPAEGINSEIGTVDMEHHFMELSERIGVMERNRENYAFRMLFSNRKFIGKYIILIKRIVRKCLKWYIEPICFQQTDFNNAVTPAIGRITEILGVLKRRTEENENSQKQLAERYEESQKQLVEKYEESQKQLVERYEDSQQQLSESKEYVAKLEERLTVLEKTNQIVNINLEAVNAELNKLKSLDIDVFKEEKENFWNKNTCAQSGEDSICSYILMALGYRMDECTYLDLGANHAKDLSNTYYLYTKGAQGVLVEANPNLIPELKFYRHRDIVLNKCIADISGKMIDFYVMNGDGLSTFDLASAEAAIKVNPNLEITETVQIETITVNEILEKYFGTAPTMLNIDIEGQDIEILKSIDFQKYRPLIVITEMIDYRPHLVVGEKNQEIYEYMNEMGYIEYAFTGINSIFIDQKQVSEKV